jgi:hypothetical protein
LRSTTIDLTGRPVWFERWAEDRRSFDRNRLVARVTSAEAARAVDRLLGPAPWAWSIAILAPEAAGFILGSDIELNLGGAEVYEE